jgi:hypothetical protein
VNPAVWRDKALELEARCAKIEMRSQTSSLEGGSKMCKEDKECEKPEKCEGSPEECTPEQIRECHGDVKEHPCTGKTGE